MVATATQLGLVPGFALQDGDLLAELFTGGGGLGGGGLGLGNTAAGINLAGSSALNPVVLSATFTIILSAPAGQAFVQLPEIPPGTFVRIYNNTVQIINIALPDPSQSMDGNPGANTTLADGARCDYVYLGFTPGVWVSDLLGSPSV